MGTCVSAVLQDEMGVYDGHQRDGIMLDRFISYSRIESALLEYPSVLEAGVAAECRYRQQPLLKVFLALEPDAGEVGGNSNLDEGTNFAGFNLTEFSRGVQDYLRQKFNLGLALAINVGIREKLPMTRSGKILRNVLSEWE